MIGYEIPEYGLPVAQTGITQWQDPGGDGKAHTFQVAGLFGIYIVGNKSLPISEPPVNVKAVTGTFDQGSQLPAGEVIPASIQFTYG